MNKWLIGFSVFMATVAIAGTKDKSPKVTYHEMALGMRDAFNCGLVVEQHLHGRLKDNADLYRQQHDAYNCDHVEAVLNTLNDQSDDAPKQ